MSRARVWLTVGQVWGTAQGRCELRSAELALVLWLLGLARSCEHVDAERRPPEPGLLTLAQRCSGRQSLEEHRKVGAV